MHQIRIFCGLKLINKQLDSIICEIKLVRTSCENKRMHSWTRREANVHLIDEKKGEGREAEKERVS